MVTTGTGRHHEARSRHLAATRRTGVRTVTESAKGTTRSYLAVLGMTFGLLAAWATLGALIP